MKKPKITFKDVFFMAFGAFYILLVAGFIAALTFSCLGGCAPAEEPEVNPPGQTYVEAEASLAPPQLNLGSLYMEGPYQGVTEGGILAPTTRCTMIGNTMKLQLENMHLDEPFFRAWGRTIQCDALIEHFNAWVIHCEEYVDGFVPWHWRYYDFYIDRLRWDEKEYIGWAFWTIDFSLPTGSLFWCTHTFRIDTVVDVNVWN